MARNLVRATLLALLAASAAWLGLRTWELRYAYQSLWWPQTPGIVTAYNFDLKGAPLIRKICYSYQHDRQTFNNTLVQFGPHAATAQDYFNRFDMNASIDNVQVTYNPRSPTLSVLIVGPSRKDLELNLLPLPFLIAAIGLLLACKRWRRPEKTDPDA